MGSKREEERNEKIIRGLMKLPPNRLCINCNSLGPQYVCTNFWTFICMPCSGIHREFTHRVKSVSMANFTSQEVDALQKGGNQRARELFLKDWDPQKLRLPENSNADKVREFIKNVYVHKKYAVEKLSDKPPRDPQSTRSHEDEMRRASSYHSFSQSPPYDFQYEERRYGKPVASLTRKSRSDRGLCEGKFPSFSSFSRFSDRTNDEGLAYEGSHPRVSDYSVSSGGDPFRSDVLSPNSQTETWSPSNETSNTFSSEIHGHPVPHNSDANGGSTAGRIRRPQRTASSGSFGSFDSVSFKSLNSVGLQENEAEARQSIETSHDKTSSFPSPQSSTSTTFNGLDLFNEPFAPLNFTSTSATISSSQPPESLLAQSVDFFQLSPVSSVPTLMEQQMSQTLEPSPLNFTVQSQQQSVASSNSKTSDMAMPQNGGWATFIPAAVPSFGNNVGDLNPFSHQSSFNQKSAGHQPSASMHTLCHDSLKNVELTTNNAQLWNAFDESQVKQPIENVLNDRDQLTVLCAQNANGPLDVGAYETLHDGGNFNTPCEIGPPSSSLSSHSSLMMHDLSTIPEAGVHSVATLHKPTNPFDLPFDGDLESSDVTRFWDMSSLQAALPNNQMSAAYLGDANESWFLQNSVPPDGSLGYIVGQAPATQIASVPAQGPAAGNPFA